MRAAAAPEYFYREEREMRAAAGEALMSPLDLVEHRRQGVRAQQMARAIPEERAVLPAAVRVVQEHFLAVEVAAGPVLSEWEEMEGMLFLAAPAVED